MSELVSDMPSNPDWKLTISLNCFCDHTFGARQIPNQSGIEIAGAGAHRHPGGGSKTHAGVDGFAVAHCGQARAIAEVGENDPALCCFGVRPGGPVLPSETHTTTRGTRSAVHPALRNGAGSATTAPRAADHGEKPCRNTPLAAGQEIGDETPRSTESLPAGDQDRMD